MTFGSRLRTARKAKQLTQKELAAKIKAAHNSISNWENDQNMPDPDTIQNLCWALDVQPNYFFSLENWGSPSLLSTVSNEFQLTQEERTIITRYRCLDDRGKSAVLNALNHEYESLPGEKAGSSAKEA